MKEPYQIKRVPTSDSEINRLTKLQNLCEEELRDRNPKDKGKEVLRKPEDKGK
jgi:hypothetical protein